MNSSAGSPQHGHDPTPLLDFTIDEVTPMPYAAVPTLRFVLRTSAAQRAWVRGINLSVQVRVDAARRRYDANAQRRLALLFGPAEQWGKSVRSFFWTQAVVAVPPFNGSTQIDLAMPCTYDFDLAITQYAHGLVDGEIPLVFLFSGSVFYDDHEGQLRVGRVPLDREATFALPVRIWRQTMDLYFPNTAWLRVSRDTFDRLTEVRIRQGKTSWDAVLETLLPPAQAARD
jgi:hypothetical protein